MKVCVLAVVVLISLTVLVDSQRPRPPRPKRCRSADDCLQDQCCVSVSYWGGRCKQLAKEGERCKQEMKFNGVHMLQCPCQDGLECISEKTLKWPWGGVIYIRPRCTKSNTTTEEITTVDDVSSEKITTVDDVISEEVTTIDDVSSEEVTTSAEQSSKEVTSSEQISEESKEE